MNMMQMKRPRTVESDDGYPFVASQRMHDIVTYTWHRMWGIENTYIIHCSICRDNMIHLEYHADLYIYIYMKMTSVLNSLPVKKHLHWKADCFLEFESAPIRYSHQFFK